MNAEIIAKALGGRKVGTCWMACCLVHDDHEPSLSLRDADDGTVLVRCHAGCEQLTIIAALRSRGLWEKSEDRRPRKGRRQPHRGTSDKTDSDEAKRTAVALSIWRAARRADGTLVETYFSSRGLHLSPSSTLRFHAGLKHPSGTYWPVMVGLVTRGTDDVPLAIHRTFLARDGSGKAPVEPQKMMLGPCHGGAVRLGIPSSVLMVGEGIETCLAAMQAKGLPVWAALSAPGLRALVLPSDVGEVIVLADGDDPGEAAAHACAVRWSREGRRVRDRAAAARARFQRFAGGHSPAPMEGAP